MEAGVFSVGNPANLTSLDVACGMPLGWNSSPPPRPHRSSLDEFASLLFSSSFGRGPCYMPFSGGSESSTWLAVATRYARSHGHDDPIPITLHYPGLASPEQLGLQEHVIAQLGLADWERVEPEEDLDLIGPIAGAAMRQTGPLWPPHAYVMAPLLEAARDGVFLLLTALEDFFTWWRWAPLVSVVARHRRPTARDAALLSTMLMPVALRVRAARRQGTPPPMPWLRPAAEKRALALLRTRQAAVPLRCNHAMTAQSTHRCFTGAAGTFRALGEALGTTMDQPQCQPGVVESFAGACGWRGFADLRAILQQLAGDLLPADLLVERPAPDAIGVFFGARSREFASSWSGGGLDESIVDVDTLRQNWLSDRPDPRTACLLQYAWLTEQLAGASCPFTTTHELILTHQHN